MSSSAIQTNYSSLLDRMNGPNGVSNSSNGGNSIQNELAQFLQMLIQELEQALNPSQSSGSGGGGGMPSPSVGAPAGGGTPSPSVGAPAGGGTPSPSVGAPAGGGGNAGGAGGSTLPTGVNSSDPATAIAQDLESRYGLNATQAAGVLGNLQQESGLQGNINQGGATGAPSGNFADDNGNGWGLAQWGGSRKQGEIDYANQHGLDPGSLQANIGFMNQELDGSYNGVIKDLKNTSTAQDAAAVFCKEYEGATDPQMGNRDQYAQDFLNKGL